MAPMDETKGRGKRSLFNGARLTAGFSGPSGASIAKWR
jgi:hypothetical protein